MIGAPARIVSCAAASRIIFSTMPKISLSVPHQLGQETAKNRIAGLIADSRQRFAGQISQVSENWDGYVDAISFQALGFSVTGKIDVQPNQVLIESQFAPRRLSAQRPRREGTPGPRAGIAGLIQRRN